MKKIILLALACIMFSGCGPRGFSVRYKGKDISFEKKAGLASFRPDLGEGQVVLASYDPEYRDKSVMTIPDPDKPGQILIGFHFKKNTEDFKDPIKPGDFSDKIKYVWIANGETKDRVTFSENGSAITGKLVVNEVSEDLIKGVIEVVKNDTTIAGTFEAKILSKHL